MFPKEIRDTGLENVFQLDIDMKNESLLTVIVRLIMIMEHSSHALLYIESRFDETTYESLVEHSASIPLSQQNKTGLDFDITKKTPLYNNFLSPSVPDKSHDVFNTMDETNESYMEPQIVNHSYSRKRPRIYDGGSRKSKHHSKKRRSSAARRASYLRKVRRSYRKK
jgi:hypothetical protein